MLKQKKISLKLIKQGSSHIRIPAENFNQLNAFSSYKIHKILKRVEEAYPGLSIIIDLRNADISIIGDLLRLKKFWKEDFNYTLLMEESGPHRFVLASLSALRVFNIIFSNE